MATEIAFTGHIRNWALSYLRNNHWRIASMCDKEDLEQEAFWIFWRVKTQHPEITNPDDFFRLYKVGLRFRMKKQSKACFPNGYNGVNSPGHCISLTKDDGSDLLESIVPSMAAEAEEYLDLLGRMPDELKEVWRAIVREALGIEVVPACLRRRLGIRWPRGLRKRPTLESLNSALCRHFGLDSSRDLFEELEMSLESDVLAAAGIKLKSKEPEQKFLRRVANKLNAAPDEEYAKLPLNVRTWHDKAVLAINEGEEIPPLTEGEAKVAKKGKAAVKAAAKPTKTSKRAQKVEEEEEEDEDELELAAEDDEDEDLEDDEDEDLEDEDEEDEEEEPAPKRGKAAKAGKAGKSSKATKGEPEIRVRGRQPSISDKMKIGISKKYEGAGEKRAEQFKVYKDGMTVKQFLAKGGNRRHLLRDRRQGYITLEG